MHALYTTANLLPRHDGHFYYTSKDTHIDIRQCCNHLAKTGDWGVFAVPSVVNPLFPVSSRDWFTVISCLIVCVTDICCLALYVAVVKP